MPEHLTTTAPGWYPDPQDPSKARYWDGQAWSDQTQALEALGTQPPDAEPPEAVVARPQTPRPTGEAAKSVRSGGRPPLLAIAVGLAALLVIGVSAAFLLTSFGSDGGSEGEIIAAGSTAEEESTVAEEEGAAAGEGSEESSPTSGESGSPPDAESVPPPPSSEGSSSGSEASSDWPSGQSAWTVILASKPSRSAAEVAAERARSAGLAEVGLLRSDDHSSLNPGLWVAYTGVLAKSEATARGREARSAGFGDAYTRFVSGQ